MTTVTSPPPLLTDAGRLLVVGLEPHGITEGITVPYLPLANLDAAALRRAAPDLILCALFAADMAAADAFALVERLEALKYRGQILVICPALPKPRMVEAELQALGPGPMLTLIARD